MDSRLKKTLNAGGREQKIFTRCKPRRPRREVHFYAGTSKDVER